MKKKISREVKIGFFAVGMIILLYLGINFIKSQDIFSRNMTYYAVYDNSAGIEASSPVVIKGYRVGTVDKVWYDMSDRTVKLEFSIKKDYPIPNDSEAKITSSSFMGSKVIELKLGESNVQYQDGDTIRSVIEPGLIEMATGEYDKLKAQATTLVDQLSTAMTSVNEVLSKQNVENLSATLANLNSLTGNVDKLVEKEVAETMRNFSALSGALQDFVPKIEKTLNNVHGVTDTLPTLVTQAANALDELNVSLSAINNGDGTIGQLIHDKTLYCNLTAASNSLILLLQDLKQNPGRYVNFSVFGGKK